jgi:hypothetical protein
MSVSMLGSRHDRALNNWALYDENSKKGSKWIDEISSVIWGLRTQPSKAIG